MKLCFFVQLILILFVNHALLFKYWPSRLRLNGNSIQINEPCRTKNLQVRYLLSAVTKIQGATPEV